MRPLPARRGWLPLLAAALGLVLVASLTGCQSSAGTPTSPTRATGASGGTLEVLAAAGAVTHLDPQRMRTNAEAEIGRLLYRGVTAFPTTTGPANRRAVPDLAAGPGRPSDDAKTWTFTLRRGLHFQDGSTITSTDVRRGVERAFLPAFGGPPAYLRQVIDCGAGYAGPPSGDCPAVETPDARTVTFHLRTSVGDFPDVLARPAFLPVPAGDDLDHHPVASGPYEVAAYTPGQRLTLKRNPAWVATSDPIRPALPNEVEVALGLDPDEVVSRLAGDGGASGQDATAVPLGVSVPVDRVARLAADPSDNGRLDRGFDGSVDAVAFNTTTAPLDNVAVRTALVYALSRAGYRDAEGGAAVGALATTVLSPAEAAYRPFDLWHAPADGDPAKARTALTAAGYPDGFTLTLDADGDPMGGHALSAALGKVGVTTQPAKTGKDAPAAAVTLVHWAPVRPAASAVLPPLLCSCGDHNVSHYTSDDVDSRIAAAAKQTSAEAAEQAWAQVDMRALQDVPMVPLVHRQVVRLHGAKVGNARLSAAYGGEYDLAALAVS